MTGYSGGKKYHGHPVGIAPQPKSMLAFALDRELAFAQKIAEEKRTEEREVFLSNLKKALNDRTIDIPSFRQKYTCDLAMLKEKTKAPESKIRISAEKNLAKRRKNDRALKNDIKNMLPRYLGTINLYQDLFLKQRNKKASDDLKGLINLYFYLYKEVVRKRLRTDIYDFITSMGDSIFNYYVKEKKSN